MGVVALVLVMGLLAMACLLAGVADCELLAEQQQQQQRASSRVVVGLLPGGEEDLKSSESRISEEFENWIRHLADGNKEEQNNGGMLAEEKDRPFLHNLRYSEGTKIEGTRKSKTGRSHHVKQAADVVVESIDQLHEKDGADVGVPEQGGGGSWGETVTAAVTAQPLMQQHTKEDGLDQSYQSGASDEVVRDEWEIITSSLLRMEVVKFSNGTELQLFPSSEPIHKQLNEMRRRLGDFQQCSPCTCCDRTRSWCIPTACCYNIRCNLQGLPFGLCSFVPISCTCYGCTS
ncbi:hypothetical protein CY35_04G035100 [Sphagnum magellanicum]|nr:hypothetical protein CY35_04G035100 [Sphagnum magellanicum]